MFGNNSSPCLKRLNCRRMKKKLPIERTIFSKCDSSNELWTLMFHELNLTIIALPTVPYRTD